MKRVFQLLNEMVRDAVIPNYAIGRKFQSSLADIRQQNKARRAAKQIKIEIKTR